MAGPLCFSPKLLVPQHLKLVHPVVDVSGGGHESDPGGRMSFAPKISKIRGLSNLDISLPHYPNR